MSAAIATTEIPARPRVQPPTPEPAPAPPSTIEQCIAEAVLRYERDRMPVRQIVADVYGQAVLDPDLRRLLAIQGLRALVEVRLAEMNRSSDSLRSRFAQRGLHGKAMEADILARVHLEGKDGHPKPLALFTLADCERWGMIARAQVNGWRKRGDAMASAAELLARHKADTIGDLPDDAKDTIRRLAMKAWT